MKKENFRRRSMIVLNWNLKFMKNLTFTLLLLSSFIGRLTAQEKTYGTGDLLHGLNKLNVVGSAMYVAAHPDDENTLLITWMANEKKVRTGYIAMTRGDGGQNLLGAEKGDFAGLLRTNELLKARSIDGGEQYFTRANDFGYTKTTEEALETWGKEQILSDLVYRIRKFQPDVLITRFPPDDRAGHGHHSASSLLAEEAFDAAADPKAFPEQLNEVDTWQVKRLVWNFYNRGFTNTPPEDEGKYLRIDIGGFNPLLGESYGEIGSRARSMHKSQGFGSALFRGERIETLRHTKGDPAENDLFDGINLTWGRIKGGEIVTKLIEDIKHNFNPEYPEASVLALNQLYKLMQTLPESPMLTYKMAELSELILKFAGIHAEINAEDYNVSSGDTLKGNFRLINRSNLKVSLDSYAIPKLDFEVGQKNVLENNKRVQLEFELAVPEITEISQPYWLKDEHPKGYYIVSNQKMRGLALSPPAFIGKILLNIEGLILEKEIPITFKYVEPSIGEIYRDFLVSPEVTVTPNVGSLVFSNSSPQEALVTVKSAGDYKKGKVSLDLPKDWSSSPLSQNFELSKKNTETVLKFQITPPKTASKASVTVKATISGKTFDHSLNTIKYAHIPQIETYPKARIEVVKLDLKKKGQRVGYIVGAGDDVPQALKQIGYQVVLLSEEDLNKNLSGYQAIIVGIRAYNTNNWLPFYQNKLMEYVKNGGNVICQYQTRGGLNDFRNEMGPFPFDIGSDRVSQEDAEVRFENTESPILNSPNKISSSDFEGWVQERGLYFARDWSKEYQTVFSMNDAGESPKSGSLIHAKYGAGNYVYTGLSFFRELPDGVPGAYRLLANLISL